MKNINRNHQLVPAPGSKATRSRGLWHSVLFEIIL
jgi:hypothetical protein